MLTTSFSSARKIQESEDTKSDHRPQVSPRHDTATLRFYFILCNSTPMVYLSSDVMLTGVFKL